MDLLAHASSRSWTRNCSPFTAPLIWRAGEAEKIAGEYARLRPLGLLVGAHVLPVLSSSATVRVSPACEVHPYGFAREEINTGVADPKVRARLVEWAVHRSQVRPPTLRNSLPMTSQNGRRSFETPTSNRDEAPLNARSANGGNDL
jgi:hypothetical protein